MNSAVVQRFLNSLTKTYKKGLDLKYGLRRHWYGTDNGDSEVSEHLLKAKLTEKFPSAKLISVEDVSGGCGAMFNIYVESKSFKGLSVPKQHQEIYAALDKEIKLIHGIHIQTKIPP